MIGSYAFLNKAYFYLLMLGLLLLGVSLAVFLVLQNQTLLFCTLTLAIILIIIGLVCKVLVWYNVYSEVVTREGFKKATASGSVFQKKKR